MNKEQLQLELDIQKVHLKAHIRFVEDHTREVDRLQCRLIKMNVERIERLRQEHFKGLLEPLDSFIERGIDQHIHHSKVLYGSIMLGSKCYSVEQLEEYIIKLSRMLATAKFERDLERASNGE